MSSFLERVIPWPDADTSGYCNLHWSTSRSDGKKFWVGKPFTTFADFTSMLWGFLVPKGEPHDYYFCTSMQRTATTNKHGKPSAIRLQSNVAALKSIWIDLDVKAKGYPTRKAALAALKEFLCATKLPSPTFIVGSGGGMHVYWTFDRSISLKEWQSVATSLKNALIKHNVLCDTGCTVDSVRILRVPGTFNHKTNPPTKVELLGARETDYQFEEIAKILAPYVGAISPRTGTVTTLPCIAPHKWPKIVVPECLRDVEMEKAGDGLEPEKFEPDLSTEAILEGCPFLRETLAGGGAENANPLWNLTTLAATFLPDGAQLAHDLAKGHSTYTHDETKALYERKQREVEERGLRWPSCRAFEAAGCTQCSSCRHFGNIKSPLNLGLTSPSSRFTMSEQQVGGGTTSVDPLAQHDATKIESHAVEFRGHLLTKDTLHLPPGYFVNQEGIVCAHFADNKTGMDDYASLFQDPVWEPWTQAGGDSNLRGLHFTTVGPLGAANKRIFIPATAIPTEEKWQRFMIEGCSPALGRSKQHMEAFLGSWQHQVEQNRGSVAAKAFGWMKYNGAERNAFAYGERQWNCDGTDAPAGYIDEVLRSAYDPTGLAEPWQRAADLVVFSQNRADLELLLASAFGAPLIAFSGQPGGTLSATGLPGAGKTTTITIAQAVWGCPSRTKEVLGTTPNSILSKMAHLGNLPVYWDEIKTKEQLDRLENVLFDVNEGRGKGRLDSSLAQRPVGRWNTIMTTGSNKSIYDHMVSKGHTTSAGLNRVIEFTVDKLDTGDGHHVDVDQLVRNELDANFGIVGLEYTKLLARESPTLTGRINTTIKEFTDAVGGDRHEERIWTAVAASCFLGATLANAAGLTRFHLPMLRSYLVGLVLKCRGRVTDESIDVASEINIEEVITAFLRDHQLGTIVTDTCTNGRKDSNGKTVNVIRALPAVGARPLSVQFVRNLLMVRLSRRRLRDWLTANENEEYTGIMDGLRKLYKAEAYQGHLGARTLYCGGKERLVDLHIHKDTGLWYMLEALCKGDGRAGLPETAEVAA